MKFKPLYIKKLQNPRKGAEAENGGEVISYTASTAKTDRMGDVIEQNWDLSNFERNPVILWNHRSDLPPIGKSLQTKVHNGNLMIDIEFDTDDFSQQLANKAQRGFLNAVSVGFSPIVSKQRKDLPTDHEHYSTKGGMLFERSELLEVSLVSIPANGQATTARNYDDSKLLTAMKTIIRGELLAMPRNNINAEFKSILSIKEEDDRYIVEFAKYPEEMPEDLPEELEEDIEEAYNDKEEEEEEKSISTLTQKDWDRIWSNISGEK